MNASTGQGETGFVSRWRIYFGERFPPLQHGLLIAAFTVGTVLYGYRLRAGSGLPDFNALAVAFVTTFLFFLQLRILDEFKDYEDDARWRPYRPVPRGLVTLRALGWLWFWAALVQLVLALFIHPWLVMLLVLVLGYSWIMRVEFFVPLWLKAHPVAYMASHMVIVPMIALYATACDWMPQGGPPANLGWLLLMSYAGFSVIEIGRKIRAPSEEEEGVETYTALWGQRGAVLAWFGVMALTAVLAVLAGREVGSASVVAAVSGSLLVIAGAVGMRFLRRPLTGYGKRFQVISGLWILALYLSVGAGWGLTVLLERFGA